MTVRLVEPAIVIPWAHSTGSALALLCRLRRRRASAEPVECAQGITIAVCVVHGGGKLNSAIYIGALADVWDG